MVVLVSLGLGLLRTSMDGVRKQPRQRSACVLYAPDFGVSLSKEPTVYICCALPLNFHFVILLILQFCSPVWFKNVTVNVA